MHVSKWISNIAFYLQLKYMTCLVRNEPKLCKEKIFQLQFILNVLISKVCSPEFWCILSDLDMQLEQS